MKEPKPSCRICGSTQFRKFAKKNGFHLDRCQKCRLIQVTDDLSNISLEELYGQEFFDDQYNWLQKEGKARQREYEKYHHRMGEIEELKREKGAILDIGCSFGFFLDVARSRGWKAVGVDIGDYAAKFARTKLGLEVHSSDLLKAPLKINYFDVITLWNVIEHLDGPVEALNRINVLLKKGGLLVFTTGAEDSYLAKIQGLRWRMYCPPIHVANYNLKAVQALLEKTGFTLQLRSFALPREALLQRLQILRLLRKVHFSDKMMIFAQKTES